MVTIAVSLTGRSRHFGSITNGISHRDVEDGIDMMQAHLIQD